MLLQITWSLFQRWRLSRGLWEASSTDSRFPKDCLHSYLVTMPSLGWAKHQCEEEASQSILGSETVTCHWFSTCWKQLVAVRCSFRAALHGKSEAPGCLVQLKEWVVWHPADWIAAIGSSHISCSLRHLPATAYQAISVNGYFCKNYNLIQLWAGEHPHLWNILVSSSTSPMTGRVYYTGLVFYSISENDNPISTVSRESNSFPTLTYTLF